MGWWSLSAWKKDANGKDIELSDADLEHIAQQIKMGCHTGEIVNGE